MNYELWFNFWIYLQITMKEIIIDIYYISDKFNNDLI